MLKISFAIIDGPTFSVQTYILTPVFTTVSTTSHRKDLYLALRYEFFNVRVLCYPAT